MFAVGRAWEDLSGDRRDLGLGLWQRENASGRGAPQVALHESDPRGRGRFRHWRHSGPGAEIGRETGRSILSSQTFGDSIARLVSSRNLNGATALGNRTAFTKIFA